MRDLRTSNRARVLRRLYFDGQFSRHELAGATGLSQASVSNVVGELVEDQVVVEAGLVGSDGGRPRVLLRVNPDHACVVGVDVGETHVLVEVFDLTLRRLAMSTFQMDTIANRGEAVVERVLAGLDQCVQDSGVDPSRLLGVGVGVPGLVERGSELLVHAQTVGWNGVPLERMLRAGTDLPLFIDNGANTLGQAEMWFGAGRGARNAVIALIGSGVGASVIADGVPYRGASGGAGEWGHTTLSLDGRPCRCGAHGCLEAYIGAKGVLGRHREAAGLPPEIVDEEVALRELLAEDSPAAREVLNETARYAGAGIGNLINLFNPERVIVGGWAGLLLGEQLLPAIREVAAKHSLHHPYQQAKIKLCELGTESVAMGAATLPVAEFLSAGGVRSAALMRPTG
ncbi:MAG TPA: ROK family transcriptional regulator [Umezawaea sp.]|nr:ROK family transcriptional regulator [Umezawaea sp.]